MSVRPVLRLGHPALYEPSRRVAPDELRGLGDLVADLHDTLMEFRARTGAGRAVAAPQIGEPVRVIYVHVDDRARVLVNPEWLELSDETIEVWDDCLCFPELLVRVERHAAGRLRSTDLGGVAHEWSLEGDLAELLQHEVDHLDGILAVSRALDARAFAWRGEVRPGAVR